MPQCSSPHVKRVNPGEGLLAAGVESEGASLYVGIEEIESKGTNIDEEGGALHEEHPVVARVGEEEAVIVRRGEKKRCSAESPKILDALVSGGVPAAAEASKLTFMVGGLEEAYLAAKSFK
ncbi:hypothetical protein ZEAMMB73_Zm00001d012129 [Zea mays]|uniref:6-phosphogluconate dehydrogenase NADP-binding domain-containing protein n=1 Tax=Zea mays TaxID=4577 RepID=A0A1D6G6T4_MAIZE|nr:hypothetical protein ZEAMMB73_Zm00001d012129 [Zea mays]